MGNDSTKSIEAWFAAHNDDGEFVCGERTVPYSVIGPADSIGQVIFTTKPMILSTAIQSQDVNEEFGMVGRYGLPCKGDLRWICDLVGSRRLLFLGDMDPVDLMIFAWLRAILQARPVKYLGVSDDFLNSLQVCPTESLVIASAPSEEKSLVLLEKVFPDFRETVGHKCAKILMRGQKIELEAIVSAEGSIAPMLASAERNG